MYFVNMIWPEAKDQNSRLLLLHDENCWFYSKDKISYHISQMFISYNVSNT